MLQDINTDKGALKTVEALLAMIGQDAVWDMLQDTSSHFDYVKT